MLEREESKSVMCNKSRLILYFVENNGTGDQKVQVNQNNMTICVHKHNQKMTRNFDSFHTLCTSNQGCFRIQKKVRANKPTSTNKRTHVPRHPCP